MARRSKTVITCAAIGEIHTPTMSDALAAAEKASASDPTGRTNTAVLAVNNAQDSLSGPDAAGRWPQKNSFSLPHFSVRKPDGFRADGRLCRDIESLNAHSCICRTIRTALRWPKRAGRQSANTATKQLPTELLPTDPLVVV